LKFYFYGRQARGPARQRLREGVRRGLRADDRPKEKREPSSSHFLRLFRPLPDTPSHGLPGLPRRPSRFRHRRSRSSPSLPPSLPRSLAPPSLSLSRSRSLFLSFSTCLFLPRARTRVRRNPARPRTRYPRCGPPYSLPSF